LSFITPTPDENPMGSHQLRAHRELGSGLRVGAWAYLFFSGQQAFKMLLNNREDSRHVFARIEFD